MKWAKGNAKDGEDTLILANAALSSGFPARRMRVGRIRIRA
jgi:hypothetical protein